jgi:hypothetical protein
MNKYKNKEELYFSYYLDELKKYDIIDSYTYEEETFKLSEDIKYTHMKYTQLKTKVKKQAITKSLLKPCTYTPDFIILANSPTDGFFNIAANNPIFISTNDLKCYVDVKGMFAGRTNSTQYTFPLKQKWMYQKYNIYTNKVVPEKLFAKTFTPKKVIEEEIFKRDNVKKGIKKGDSKLKFEVKTIEEYLKSIN